MVVINILHTDKFIVYGVASWRTDVLLVEFTCDVTHLLRIIASFSFSPDFNNGSRWEYD